MMTILQFQKLLSVYGADMARWPQPDIAPARALLAESLDARNLYKEAEALDHALDAFAPPPLPAGLAVRAANESLMRARSAKKKSGFRWPTFSFGGSWLPAGGLVAVAAAIVLMVFLAHQQPSQTQGSQDVADASAVIESLDQMADADEKDEQETEQVIAMLQTSWTAPSTPPPTQTQTQNPPQTQNPVPAPATGNGGVTSDELMNTLFDNDDSNDDEKFLQSL
jgi:hypothetical protein